MIEVPVCIIGCGPIGLTGALLLSRHGVPSMLVERRSELNTHPRSRFVDTNTMELFRELGIDATVEATGLDADWTAFNRWSDNLAVEPYAEIPSPTFFRALGPHSPCLPAMTVQDQVERALMSRIIDDPNITVMFDTEAMDLTQTDDATRLTLRNTRTDERQSLEAQYTIGADGPGSSTRAVIGARLEVEPEPVYMQDVLFDADLRAYVGERKGSLLYTQPPEGVVIFQPLDGVRRWRCQASIGGPELLAVDAMRDRIRASLGTTHDVPLDITSMSLWQPTPGCVTRFRDRRIFLAGDAAHVAVPTGGLGNNSGFAGIRNLAWKLAYVIRGLADEAILDTYETEHRPVATERIAFGVQTTISMRQMMIGHRLGHDIADDVLATHQYADYDHVVRGFEMTSSLIAPNHEPAPEFDDPTGFVPLVRAGCRAPHVWVDDEHTESILDWFGAGYVLVLGSACDVEAWAAALTPLAAQKPLALGALAAERASDPYTPADVVLVRPDGVIANRFTDSQGPHVDAVGAYLPWATG
ncbi:MAG: FAD-dependent monooxygenase [Actinomycetota bacterium]